MGIRVENENSKIIFTNAKNLLYKSLVAYTYYKSFIHWIFALTKAILSLRLRYCMEFHALGIWESISHALKSWSSALLCHLLKPVTGTLCEEHHLHLPKKKKREHHLQLVFCSNKDALSGIWPKYSIWI